MTVKPDRWRAREALDKRWWVMELEGGGDAAFLRLECRGVEIAMKARAMEMVK